MTETRAQRGDLAIIIFTDEVEIGEVANITRGGAVKAIRDARGRVRPLANYGNEAHVIPRAEIDVPAALSAVLDRTFGSLAEVEIELRPFR